MHSRDPALFQTNAIEARKLDSTESHQKCAKSSLRKCFPEQDTALNNRSCLYEKFLSSRPGGDKLERKEIVDNELTQTNDNENVIVDESRQNNLLLYRQANLQKEKKLDNEPNPLSRHRIETYLIYLIIGVSAALVMAAVSLIMSSFMLTKRNKFAYYATASTAYPVEER